MRKSAKKLALSKETIRTLQDSELTRVAGGNTGPVAISPNRIPGGGGGALHQIASADLCYVQVLD